MPTPGLHKSVTLPTLTLSPKAAEKAAAKAAADKAAAELAASQSQLVTMQLFKEDPALKGKTCDELVKCCQQREAAATPVCTKSHELMQSLSEELSRVTQRVNDCLDKRCAELSDLKDKLLDQQREADVAIYEMGNFVMKIQRAKSDGLSEKPTEEELAKQAERVQKAEAAFQQIKDSRAKLAEDLRSKAFALKIDESCKILTLTKVQVGPRLRKKKAKTTGDLGATDATCWPAGVDSPGAVDSP